MKVRELRTILRSFEKPELVKILVEMYKVLPKTLIEEKSIDGIVENRSEYIEARQRERVAAKRIAQANQGENVTSIAPVQKWMAIPEYARQLLLNNVWCSHCGETRWLGQYTLEPAGPAIVLRGNCPVCHHEVARYVEIE